MVTSEFCMRILLPFVRCVCFYGSMVWGICVRIFTSFTSYARDMLNKHTTQLRLAKQNLGCNQECGSSFSDTYFHAI